jgi:hypothetical protein
MYHVTTSDCTRSIRRVGLLYGFNRRYDEHCYGDKKAVYLFRTLRWAIRWADYMIQEQGTDRRKIRIIEVKDQSDAVNDVHRDFNYAKDVSCRVPHHIEPDQLMKFMTLSEANNQPTRYGQPV